MKTYKITTEQNGAFHFFTKAKSHKDALLNLIDNSSDYKNIVKDKEEFTIRVKAL